jgi:branched-chain amino acid transport system ATP-binding protein
MADKPRLEVRDVHVFFGKSHILQGITLEVGDHPLSVVGRNGMGKTTLCLTLMGMTPIAGGSVRFEGRELVGLKPHQIAAAGVSLVPQGRRIFPSLTVDEHLLLVSQRNGRRWTMESIYELFPALRARRQHHGNELSGGEQQMLAIGRALLTNPRFLIMDEPSEGLAPLIVEQLIEVLRKLAAEGMAVLLIEQNLGVATAVSERLAIMVSGRIAAETTSAELLADEAAQRRYLGVSPHA